MAITLCMGEQCLAEGKRRRTTRRELCSRCYQRWWKVTPPEERAALLSRARPVSERIWSNVSPGGPDDCREWLGFCDGAGYGIMSVGGKPRKVHRLALILALGRDEPDRLACHTCDNRPCCNPRHLYFGTHEDNARDAVERNRIRVGSQRPSAILNEESVLRIRHRFADGERTMDLADEYLVAPTTITGIVRGRKWRHVGGPIVPAGTPQIRTRRAA